MIKRVYRSKVVSFLSFFGCLVLLLLLAVLFKDRCQRGYASTKWTSVLPCASLQNTKRTGGL